MIIIAKEARGEGSFRFFAFGIDFEGMKIEVFPSGSTSSCSASGSRDCRRYAMRS